VIKLLTDIPGPKAREYLELSRRYEPRSMSEQPPVVWATAEGVWVTDVDGNVFLDFSSGVLVANAGHSVMGDNSAGFEAAVRDFYRGKGYLTARETRV